MSRHIGIVACSAEGAMLCYRTLVTEGEALLGPYRHPEISLHSLSLGEYVVYLDRHDLRGVAGLMLRSARALAAAGAEFLICPDNTIHQALPFVSDWPLPWLHIADVVADEAVARGFRRLGLTGTRWLVDSSVYPDSLAARGLECVRPDEADKGEIHRIIMDELVRGVFTSVPPFQRIFATLGSQGCDAVIMGCTEIPLIMNDRNSPLPTLDSTRLLARAALRRAL